MLPCDFLDRREAKFGGHGFADFEMRRSKFGAEIRGLEDTKTFGEAVCWYAANERHVVLLGSCEEAARYLVWVAVDECCW